MISPGEELEPLSGIVVLVVDDDPELCAALRFSLQIEGYVVRTYVCAADLLAETRMPPCGCLVIDYKMPDINGLDLIALLRTRGVDLPAILITSSPTELVRSRARRNGVPVIEKPLFGDALPDAIRAAVRPTA